jgi:hypothetical protein
MNKIKKFSENKMNNTDTTPDFHCHMSENQKLITFAGAAGISFISLVIHSIKIYLSNSRDDADSSESNEEEVTNDIEGGSNNKTESNHIEVLDFTDKLYKGCTTLTPTLLVTTASFALAVPLIGGWALTTMDLDCSGN